MKLIAAQLAIFLTDVKARRNVRDPGPAPGDPGGHGGELQPALPRPDEREGQAHSWLTGLYWTLTVMSTLGFGDITFHSDLGRAFSIVVLMLRA